MTTAPSSPSPEGWISAVNAGLFHLCFGLQWHLPESVAILQSSIVGGFSPLNKGEREFAFFVFAYKFIFDRVGRYV